MKTRISARLFILAQLVSVFFVQAATTEPKVGDKAPPLELRKLLHAPDGAEASWDKLKGKVVVLEFWATWCGPCVAAIPHLNELAEKFKDQPVQFIAITGEKDEAVVKQFLEKKPINAWIGLDKDEWNKAYAVTAIPHTVIVNKEGVIAAITYPMTLTEAHLKDALAGKKTALAQPMAIRKGMSAGIDPRDTDSAAAPLFQVLIRPSTNTVANGIGGKGNLTGLGYSVKDMVASVQRVTKARIIIPESKELTEEQYDVIAKLNHGDDATRNAILLQAIRSTFSVEVKTEPREMEVYLLRVAEPNAKGLQPTATPKSFSARSGPGQIEGINIKPDFLCQSLENRLGKPVVDESSLSGGFDLQLTWESDGRDDLNPAGLMKALREQLGLELVLAKRAVEVVVVEKARQQSKSPTSKRLD